MTTRLTIAALLLLAGNVFATERSRDAEVLTERFIKPCQKIGSPFRRSNLENTCPRPQLRRNSWQDLNGSWYYSILAKDDGQPISWQGKINVPYAVESELSGVKNALLPEQRLWYKRSFMVSDGKGLRQVLHFGAVDQECTVWVNGREAGRHSGGFDAFSFDISALVRSGSNELVVAVTDATEKGDHPHGKQSLRPMWTRYTAVSGIWQTVWLESVPLAYIDDVQAVVDVDGKLVKVLVKSAADLPVSVALSGKDYAGRTNVEFSIPVADPVLWSPERPHLYHFTVRMGKDVVSSYFGMRKIEVRADDFGVERLFLNGKPYFSFGTLDQGYWPDGLYTAPGDEALKKDILLAKAMGFNSIRKHVKVEPERWFYLCDSIGMLVWQDMPSWRGFREVPEAEKLNFVTESKRIIGQLAHHPSIIMWCVFNEDWGVFDQKKVMEELRPLDASRIWNANSGSFKEDYSGSDVTDRHMYPGPTLPPYEKGKAMLCGEYGGIYQATPGHEFIMGKGWGHPSPPGFSLEQRYEQMIRHLVILKEEGLAGAIYTQPYDLETEENGLMTYDRSVMKVPVERIRALNSLVTKDN